MKWAPEPLTNIAALKDREDRWVEPRILNIVKTHYINFWDKHMWGANWVNMYRNNINDIQYASLLWYIYIYSTGYEVDIRIALPLIPFSI